MSELNNYLQLHIDEIIKYKNDGYYDKDIAKIFNTSKSSINRILRTNNYNSRPKFTDEMIDDVIELYTNGKSLEFIGNKYHKDYSFIKNILIDNNIYLRTKSENSRKYIINEDYFETINTQNKAYILGLIMSDGNIFNNIISICLQENDVEILNKINNELDNTKPLYFIDNSNKLYDGKYKCKNQYVLRIISTKMVNDLKKYGVTENKSLTLHYPFGLDDSLFPSFLLGYIDGDGHIYKDRLRISITGNIYFLTELKNKLCELYGMSTYMKSEHNSNITFSLYIGNKNNVLKIYELMYKNTTIYMERKYEDFKYIFDKFNIQNPLSA